MFTIRNMFPARYVTVLNDVTRDASKAPAFVPSDTVRLQDLWEKSKGLFRGKEREAFLAELRKVTEQNKEKHAALIKDIDTAILTADFTGDKTQLEKLRDFKKAVEEEYAQATQKLEEQQRTARATAMQNRGGLKESVESGDNNARQAEALIVGLKKLAQGGGVTALIKAVEEGIDDPSMRASASETGIDQKKKLDLSDLNMRGLVDYMVTGKKETYRSNGTFGLTERWVFGQIEALRNANKDLPEVFGQIAKFYDAGQTTEDWLLALNKDKLTLTPGPTFKPMLLTYLSEYREDTVYSVKFDKEGKGKLETKDRSFMTLYAPGELQGYLAGLPDANLLERVKKLIEIGGGTISANSLDEMQRQMFGKPELRAAYIKGLNFVALSNNRADFFATGKLEAGINGSQANTLVEKLTESSVQEAMKKTATKTLAEAKAALDKDPKATEAQRKSIHAKIDAVVAGLNSTETFKTFTVEWAAALTNRRVGGGVSASRDLDSIFADSVTLAGGGAHEFGQGYGGMLALIFTKEIFASEKLELGAHYGLSYANTFAPLLGIHGRYEDILASITGTPVGYSIYAGIRLGNNRGQAESIQRSVARSQDAIRTLAKETDTAKLDLSKIISDPSIRERMTVELKNVLTRNSIGAATTPEAKYMVMYSSIVEVMNMEVLRLYREKNDMGWTLDQIGVNFGELAGLIYVLPGFRIEKNDLQIQFTQYKRNEVVERKSESIDPKSLFAPAVFGKGKEYTLPLVQGSKIASTATSLPNGASWDLDGNGNATSIVGLKDYGVKVTLTDGKYKVEYDTSKPVAITEAVASVNAPILTESLDRDAVLEKALSTKEVRKAFSNLLINPTRKGMANEFALALQNLSSDNPIDNAKGKFLTVISKPVLLPAFKDIYAFIQKETDPKKLQLALFDLRGAMMMDMNQAENVSRNKDGSVSVGEGIEATKKRFDAMLNSGRMSALLADMGISPQDYKDLIQKGNGDGKALTVGAPKPGVLGAFASLKTSGDSYMARMPAGTVRYARSSDREFVTEITSASPVTKRQMLMTIIPENSLTEISYRNAIAKALSVKEVSSKEFVELMTVGKSTINGRMVTMTDTKYYLAAYGDCTNPGIALQVGKISTDGVQGSAKVDISATAETAIMKEVTRYSVGYRLDTTGVSFAAGTEGKDKTIRTPDQTEYRTETVTRNVQVGPENITGVQGSQVVNIPGGGTVPVNQLTVAQRIQLLNGTLTLPTQVTVQVPVNVPGTVVVIRDPKAPNFNGVTSIILPPSTGMNDEQHFTQMVDSALPNIELKQFKNGQEYLNYLATNGLIPPAKK